MINIKNKLRVLYNKVTSNLNKINKKEQDYKKRFEVTHFKVPTILYDSDWIYSDSEGHLDPSNIFFHHTQSYNTAQISQKVPMQFSYIFNKELDIPENQLPFVKPILMIEGYPDVQVEGVMTFQPYEYSTDKYYRIYGDSTLIYQGFAPYTYVQRKYGQSAIDNGHILETLTSKWPSGTLNYTIAGDSYEVRNSYIMSVLTTYDVTEDYPGEYSQKRFECAAIDSISDTSVTGTGTYTVITALGGGSYSTVTTKNVTMTAPMFEDYTKLMVSGTLYKNSIYQGAYTLDSLLMIEFAGVLGGNATLTNFGYLVGSLYKLFYSNKRAREFKINISTFIPFNLPTTTDYETGTLPYTHLEVDINPDPYPLSEQSSGTAHYKSNERFVWSKVAEDKFKYHRTGTVYASIPATKEVTVTRTFVDETYSQSGGTYTRDAENRDNKVLTIYTAPDIALKAKLILAYNSPKDSSVMINTRKR